MMINIPKNKYLCKFTTLNKNIINSIYENNLWHARVDTLNDPFEFYFNFGKELPNSTNDLCKLMKDSHYWVKPHLVTHEREAAIQLLALSKENDLRSRIINKLIEHEKLLKKKMQTLCVCSLSEAYDEPLMWSHYSNGMRGICLMFDKELLKEGMLEFEKVEYKSVPPTVDFFKHYIEHKNGEKMALGKFLLTKHTGWTYEKEFRSVSFKVNENTNQLGFIKKLKASSLKAIIMGSKISQVDKSLLITLSEKFHFKLYIARVNTQDYKVDITELKQKTR